MATVVRADSLLTTHAVCAAAGLRDGLRTAQYYMRDMSNADGPEKSAATTLSGIVGAIARFGDRVFAAAADLSVRLFVPNWRELPSPFAPSMVEDVTRAISENRLVLTSLFTAYFFRASRHIVERCADRPILILEHRVDAARRRLAGIAKVEKRDRVTVLAEALLVLAESGAVARHGRVKQGYGFMTRVDPNVSVMAAACLALLLAEEGKPIESLDEDEFFAIAGALLSSRLADMEQAVKARDVAALARELQAVRDLY
jgi:hypothetical protein